MATILDTILESKRREVGALLANRDRVAALRDAAASAPPVPGFRAALANAPGGMALVAEIKKASPSKGIIRADFDPVWIAHRYASGGADALSVLTDREFFRGDLAYLRAVRKAVPLPLLRKDFIIDEVQLLEARVAGASAVLLIASALEPARLGELHAGARSLGLDVLVEVHDDDDMAVVAGSGARPDLVGINNRDLKTFEVSLDVTARLAPDLAAAGTLVVSESGIFTPDDVAAVRESGARAVLVGESLMRHSDPGTAAAALLGRPTPAPGEAPS